jgi:ArsR family metal-binding transcriptional regulator
LLNEAKGDEVRNQEQRAERHLRSLLRRHQYLVAKGDKSNCGAQGELSALAWALRMLATDGRVPLTETQRTTGVLKSIAEATQIACDA